jgi:histidine triad (HIT) family protein
LLKIQARDRAFVTLDLDFPNTNGETAVDTLFTKIINREIPAKIIYEDDQVLAFHDIAPQAPVHFLVIPKKPIRTLSDLTEEDEGLAGHILFTAQRLARELGCEDGFRVVMNCNELGGQTVYHIHMHVLGLQRPIGLNWPP